MSWHNIQVIAIWVKLGYDFIWIGVCKKDTCTEYGWGLLSSSVPLFYHFVRMIKTPVTYLISRSYLAGVAAAQLRWHLSNMNVIINIWVAKSELAKSQILPKVELVNRAQVTPLTIEQRDVTPPSPGLEAVDTKKDLNFNLLHLWCTKLINIIQSGGCFSNILWALQNNLVKMYNVRNHIYSENFKLKLCTCAQSMALGTSIKFQLEILVWSTTSAMHKFRENILESSCNVGETTHWSH